MRASLGAYPDDPYFDPARPSWLPYWIDTFQESAAKWGLYPGARQPVSAPPAPTIAAPQTRDQMTLPGAWDPLRAGRQTQIDYQQQLRDNAARQLDSEFESPVTVVIAAAVGLWVVSQVSQAKRKRR